MKNDKKFIENVNLDPFKKLGERISKTTEKFNVNPEEIDKKRSEISETGRKLYEEDIRKILEEIEEEKEEKDPELTREIKKLGDTGFEKVNEIFNTFLSIEERLEQVKEYDIIIKSIKKLGKS